MAKPENQTRSSWIIEKFFLLAFILILLTLVLSDPFAGRDPKAHTVYTKNHLKQIGIALYNYHESKNSFPTGGYFDETGKGYHGWQTLILPQIDQQALYGTIDFSLPWNAPENQDVFSTEVPTYHHRESQVIDKLNEEQGYAHTHLAANERMFSANRFLQHDDVKDGHSETIFAGEVVGDYLPWGHPRNWRDPAEGINQGSHTFGAPERDWCFMLMGDGSVRKVDESIDGSVLKALGTPNGGEDVGDF